jgi:hypothetical protein
VCEKLSLILGEEHRLRVVKKRVLRRMLTERWSKRRFEKTALGEFPELVLYVKQN